MYYPIQLPFLLNKQFTDVMNYQEIINSECSEFVLCFWSMYPKSEGRSSVKNIIIADGCIDLIVDFDNKQIFFSGNRRTDFEYDIQMPAYFFGARLMPGAFHQLTGLSADKAMDDFILLEEVFDDLDQETIFGGTFEYSQMRFQEYLTKKFEDKVPNDFTCLFSKLFESIPQTSKELYNQLYFSPRQCQRNFSKNFGLSPKMVLSILRFQKCLKLLTSEKAKSVDILVATNYYDQSHFNHDFKQYLGITPLELVARYKNDAFLQ